MDTIIDLLKTGVLVEGMNFMRISSIKTGETFMFRLLPRGARNTIFKLGIGWLYKHYGNVTQDEVDGNTGVNLTIPDVAPQKSETSVPPWEGKSTINQPKQQPIAPLTAPRERCFGLPNFFEETDSQCQSCKDFKGCGREILKGK